MWALSDDVAYCGYRWNILRTSTGGTTASRVEQCLYKYFKSLLCRKLPQQEAPENRPSSQSTRCISIRVQSWSPLGNPKLVVCTMLCLPSPNEPVVPAGRFGKATTAPWLVHNMHQPWSSSDFHKAIAIEPHGAPPNPPLCYILRANNCCPATKLTGMYLVPVASTTCLQGLRIGHGLAKTQALYLQCRRVLVHDTQTGRNRSKPTMEIVNKHLKQSGL